MYPPRTPALSAGPLEFTSITRNPRASVRFIFFAISGVTSIPVIPREGCCDELIRVSESGLACNTVVFS